MNPENPDERKLRMIDLRWHDRAFDELTVTELHAILALRERVFVVESACAYQEIDGLDPVSRHIWAESAGAIHAYLRIVPGGAKYDEPSLGRIVTAPEARGTGLGRVLVRRGIAALGDVEVATLPHTALDVAIRIGAQAHLEKFYNELGFVRASEPYDEDGILHVEMLRCI